MQRVRGWTSIFFVSCFTAAGNAADSKFVFSFSGEPRPVDTFSGLAGPAAFFETTENGTEIARTYKLFSHETGGEGWMSYNSTRDNPLPTIRQTSIGVYDVSLPGLGTPNPGLAQVTALGSGPAHCIAGLPVADRTTLRVRVEGWDGSKRADTDFILNYDQAVTRMYPPAHQAARVYADNWVAASYTPARSYNTGAIADSPGANTAYRMGTGLYRIHHTEIRSKPNSVWVGAAPPFELLGVAASGGSYCKVERWVPKSRGTDVYIRCYDATGKLADSRYFETYQGVPIGPS